MVPLPHPRWRALTRKERRETTVEPWDSSPLGSCLGCAGEEVLHNRTSALPPSPPVKQTRSGILGRQRPGIWPTKKPDTPGQALYLTGHTPFREGYRIAPQGRSPDFWLLSILSGLPGPVRASGCLNGGLEKLLPVTVAGPRRTFTGFPFQPLLNGATLRLGIHLLID